MIDYLNIQFTFQLTNNFKNYFGIIQPAPNFSKDSTKTVQNDEIEVDLGTAVINANKTIKQAA